MKHVKRAGVTVIVAVSCLVSALPSALAVGPQALPAIACNAGTLLLSERLVLALQDDRRSSPVRSRDFGEPPALHRGAV